MTKVFWLDMDSLIHVWWVSVWLTTIVGSPSSLLPWLVSPPQSFHSLLFLLLPLPLPKVLSETLIFSLSLPFSLSIHYIFTFMYVKAVLGCSWVVGFTITDANSNPKSVKLRDDWRQRSRPIPPGGTYPAKDHCRLIFLAI